MPVFPVEEACRAHQKRKGHGAGQISGGLGNPQPRFGEGRSPLADRLFAGSRADHHEQQDPEYFKTQKLFQLQSGLTLRKQRSNGNLCEDDGIADGDQRPDKSQELPVFYAGDLKEQRGEQDDPRLSPAIKGVQHAHGLFFIGGGTGFHNGTYQNFQKPSADGIDHHGNQDSGKR